MCLCTNEVLGFHTLASPYRYGPWMGRKSIALGIRVNKPSIEQCKLM